MERNEEREEEGVELDEYGLFEKRGGAIIMLQWCRQDESFV